MKDQPRPNISRNFDKLERDRVNTEATAALEMNLELLNIDSLHNPTFHVASEDENA